MASIRIKTHRLKKGMTIVADVYTRSGVVIVPEGTVATKEVYDLLMRHFIDEVVIEYIPKQLESKKTVGKSKVSGSRQKKIKEFSQAFQIAEDVVSKNFEEIAYADGEVNVQELVNTVQNVVNKAENDIDLCGLLFDIRHTSENLYTHSVNVALYAQLLARWVGFTPEETELTLLAGLLHDIGHMKYTDETEVFTLHGELEHNCHEKHSLHGYKIVQEKALDYRVKQAILTHHERLDESGFPMGVSFENINKIARVVAVADLYATLTITEPKHPAMSPFEMLKYMQKQEFGKYDAVYLRTFMEHQAQIFIQKQVLLNNGKTGTILMLNKLDLARPLVQVEDYYLDLSVKKDIVIKQVLD